MLPPVGFDASGLPVGPRVLFVIGAAWLSLRVGLAWVWLRRRGYLDDVASRLPLVD